jgi:hypothetical protein
MHDRTRPRKHEKCNLKLHKLVIIHVNILFNFPSWPKYPLNHEASCLFVTAQRFKINENLLVNKDIYFHITSVNPRQPFTTLHVVLFASHDNTENRCYILTAGFVCWTLKTTGMSRNVVSAHGNTANVLRWG